MSVKSYSDNTFFTRVGSSWVTLGHGREATVQQDIGEIARRGIDLALGVGAPNGVTAAPVGGALEVTLAVAESCGCHARR
jgi:hypothetical protein